MGGFKRSVLSTVLVALVALGIAGGASADGPFSSYGSPPELAGLTFPEPRVFIETQGWWVQGQTALAAPDISNDPASDFAFSSVHVHLGIPFPLGQQLVLPPNGEGYDWPYVAQWHNQQPTGKTRGVRGGGFSMGCGGLTYDNASKGLPLTEENVRLVGSLHFDDCDMDVWRSHSGTFENRFTADTTSKFGKRQYQSGAWNAQINAPAAPVAVTARGWYEGPGYTNVTLKSKAQATSLADGSWYAPGKVVSYGLAQGASKAFAYIDADIHHGSKGLVLIENKTGSSGTFVLPDLPPGDHVLLLGGWEKAAAGWNAGVLRLPFYVPEPEATGATRIRSPYICRTCPR